jgi:hypothetical protein
MTGTRYIHSGIDDKVLVKMMEHVPYLEKYFINLMGESDTKKDFIEKCRETGYEVLFSEKWQEIPEDEVRVRVHKDFILVFDTICFIRDNKIRKILE